MASSTAFLLLNYYTHYTVSNWKPHIIFIIHQNVSKSQEHLKKKKSKLGDCILGYFNPTASRVYAEDFLGFLHKKFQVE